MPPLPLPLPPPDGLGGAHFSPSHESNGPPVHEIELLHVATSVPCWQPWEMGPLKGPQLQTFPRLQHVHPAGAGEGGPLSEHEST